jgi:hypothetical protein
VSGFELLGCGWQGNQQKIHLELSVHIACGERAEQQILRVVAWIRYSVVLKF